MTVFFEEYTDHLFAVESKDGFLTKDSVRMLADFLRKQGGEYPLHGDVYDLASEEWVGEVSCYDPCGSGFAWNQDELRYLPRGDFAEWASRYLSKPTADREKMVPYFYKDWIFIDDTDHEWV